MFTMGLIRTHCTVQDVCLRLGEHESGEQSMPMVTVVQENKKRRKTCQVGGRYEQGGAKA
jgi:hypothetical protein